MKRKLSILLTMIMIVSLFVGCGAASAPQGSNAPTPGGSSAPVATEDDVIKIGVFEPMTGGNAAAGQLEYEGVLTAHSLVPEVLGKRVELVLADNKTDDVEAVTAAASLISQGVVAVIGGSGSNYCIAAGPTFEKAKIPAVATSATNPLVTLGNDYYFRCAYTDDFQGVILANYAKNNLNAKTAAIITDISDTYCIGLKEYFEESFGKENIVANVFYNRGDQDFSAQLNEVIKSDPDVVFLPSQYTEGALIMIQAQQMGYKPVFLGPEAWETDAFLEIGKDAIEGACLTAFFDVEATPNEYSTKYVEAYKDLYNGNIPISALTALGYDAYMVTIQAIEAAGTTDGPAVRDAIANLQYKGVTGNFGFDENGDAIKDTAYIKHIKDGAFKFLDIAKITE